MTEILDDIAAAQAAWTRLRANDRATFDDWIMVGRALVIGRAEAMKLAKTNKPLGSRYNRCMGRWLRQNGLDGISAQERYRVVAVIENLPAIEGRVTGQNFGVHVAENHVGRTAVVPGKQA